jgi:hypothetical protein
VPKTYFREREREREGERGGDRKSGGGVFTNEAGSLLFLPGSYPSRKRWL